MWLPLLGLVAGVIAGLLIGIQVPAEYARYTAVAILAALDAVFGAVRAESEGHFDNRVFLTGFFSNTILAALLTYLADRLGVELYLAAVVAFGVRIFNNLAIVRRRWLLREGRERHAS
jgi:small basic protein